jgi:Ca-activated chloride channel family protein
MKRRSPIRNRVVAGAVSSLLLLGLRGDVKPPGYTIRTDVRLVLLDVAVRNGAGGFVAGLSKDQFHVTENDRPQPITVFATDDVPVTVGILVDESRSMTPKRAEVLSAAQTFIRESNPKDEIFVLNFNDRVMRGLPEGVPFSDNIDQLRAALYRGIPQGRTALNDAIVAGLKQLQEGKRDKKTLIVISDGGDNASQYKRRDMFDLVETSSATIYTIGLADADDPDRDAGLLKALARISGGTAYFPESLERMVPVCEAIAKEIRIRYTIGYPAPSDSGSSLRHIHVRVAAPGRGRLTAHTRTSYRYEDIAK